MVFRGLVKKGKNLTEAVETSSKNSIVKKRNRKPATSQGLQSTMGPMGCRCYERLYDKPCSRGTLPKFLTCRLGRSYKTVLRRSCSMVFYSLYIINKAGSLIYHYDHNLQRNEVEKTYSYPLEFVLDIVDDRVVVRFGEIDGVRVGYSILAVNGIAVTGRTFAKEGEKTDIEVLEFLSKNENYPVQLKFGRPPLRTNERIMLASTFHSLYAISAQISPEHGSSGIRTLDTDVFRLHCFQTITGTKFIVLTDLRQDGMDALLRKLYQIYADYALKNPFYLLEMPVRLDLFDQNIQAAIEQVDKTGVSVI